MSRDVTTLVGGMPEEADNDDDPRDKIGCACPRTDAIDCMRVRYERYRTTAPADEPECGDPEECECSCHDYCDCCREELRDCQCEGGPF